MDQIEDLRKRLSEAEGRLATKKPMTAHDLARKLLELPDQNITVVKGEGDGYISEYEIHPGGAWLDGSTVRIQIERRANGVEQGPGWA
jgi:hypothetical protein